MRFVVTMKHADALFYAMKDVRDDLGIDEDPQVVEENVAEVEEFARKYMRYGEYLDVEFDTEKGTATVLEAK